MLKNLQGKLTIIISIPFFIASAILFALKFTQFSITMKFASGFIAFTYVLWIVLESKITIGETTKNQTKLDAGTFEFYAISRWITVVVTLALPIYWSKISIWLPISLIIYIFGITFRLIAIRNLGKFYSHRVRISNEHNIINTGPYRFIRHPAYCGMLLAHLGFILFFFNVVSLIVFLCIFIPAIVTRIIVEEKALFELKGYEEYAKTRKRLVPFIW